MGHDAHWIHICQSCCHKHLCSIRDHSLHAARHGVENTGALAVVDTESVAYLLCYTACCDYRNSIVGSTYVHHPHQCRNTQFRTAFGLYMLGDERYDNVNTSVHLYQFKHSACHHRDDNQFAHTLNTVAHGSKPSEDVKRPVDKSDGSSH